MDMDRFIGRLLDNRYEILEVIGTGGMAVVYKARCHRLNRLVAIKILKDDYSQDEEFRRRFHAESQAVAMVSHPNIVSVYDVSSSEEADYIVMELIDGISLKQYMEKKGVLNWKETLHFAIQIAKALEHAHSKGIVHRDIKPHNVMVLKNGSVKVADFGIARLMSKGNTLTKEALGSVHYISPEQAKGGRVDNRSDIYSLGVVMYEMMAGRPPYDGESPVSVAIQHINGGAPMPSTLNPNIPGGLEQIIMKAMSNGPGDRYGTAAEMLYDMDEFRKDPTILFAYHNAAAGLDDMTKIQPVVHAVPTPEQPPRTTAERVAGKAERPRTRPTQSTAKSARRRNSRHREEIVEEDEGRSKVATIAIVACVVVIVCALIVCGVIIFTEDGERIPAPKLEGMTVEEVQTTIKDITVRVTDSKHSETVPKGQIISQSPRANASILKGSEIAVVVSLGPEPKELTMENLVELDREVAVNFLTGQGIDPAKILIRTEASASIPEGKVTRTDPVEGEPLKEDQTISIWVSVGPEIQKRTLPNVQGMALNMALDVLEKNGFTNVLTEPVESSKQKDTVISQSHTAFVKYDVTTEIILQVSIGMSTSETQPPEVEFEELPTKVITLILPDDIIGEYTVTLKSGGEVLEEREILSGTVSTQFEVSGEGIVKYEFWIAGNLYSKESVDFSEDE